MRRSSLHLALILLGAAGCDKAPTHAEIRDAIEKARVCQNDVDCVNLGARCPFGCAIAVKRSEAEHIRQLLNDFEGSCVQECATPTQILCEKGLCTPK